MTDSEEDARQRFGRLQDLFHELEPLDQPARRRRLATLRDEDPHLHSELSALLGQDSVEDETLVQREQALEGGLLGDLGGELGADEDAMPERIGPYRLVRLLGQGGMGRVWEAEQTEPLVRRVALKVLRPRVQSADVLARFRAERQALAVLDHRNIAKVLDAGETDNGQPWFAMELVEGVPITEWAEAAELDLERRIELMVPICDAIHHAHLKGVIHRDLKPSNILVSADDAGQPVPKVIDFGIAKAIEQPVLARTMATQLGQLVGTPEYMSPEQATLGAVDVDARSDVYSLGLVLYELLVGQLPITIEELRGLAFDEICRRIREAETPRPSTRLLSVVTSSTETQEKASVVRSAVSSWSRRVRTDLDAVLLKSLAKDRERRYESAAAFGHDLSHFLNNEPVDAAVPTWSYRAAKFVRRNRLLVSLAALAAAGLVGGLVTATLGLLEAQRARTTAEEAREEALESLRTSEETGQFLIGLFSAPDPRNNPGVDLTASALLERGVERIDRLDDEPRVQARLLETLGDANWSLGAYDEAETLLERAVELRQEAAPDPLREAQALNTLGHLYRDRSEWEESEAAHRRAIQVLSDADRAETREMGSALNSLGIVLRRQGRLDEAADVLERTVGLTERLEEQPSSNVAVLLANLAAVHSQQDRLEEALAASERSLETFRQVLPENHPNFAGLLGNISIFQRRLGRLGLARAAAEESLRTDRLVMPETHPNIARALHNLGAIDVRLGRIEEARRAFQEGLELVQKQLGDDNYETVIHREGLGLISLITGRLQDAIRHSERALEIARRGSTRRNRLAEATLTRQQTTALRRLGRWNEAVGLAAELAAEEDFESADEQALRSLQLALALWGRSRSSMAQDEDEPAARAAFARAMELSDCGDPQMGPQAGGDASVEECVLDQLVTTVNRADWYAATGDDAAALSALRMGVEGRNWNAWALARPEFESLSERRPREFEELQRSLQSRLERQLAAAFPAG